MISFLKKYQIILFLAFLAVVLLVVKILYVEEEEERLMVEKVFPPAGEEFSERSDFEFKIYFSRDISGEWDGIGLVTEPEIEFEKSLGEELGVLKVLMAGRVEAGKRYVWKVFLRDELIYEWDYKSSDLSEEEKRSRGIGDPERMVEIIEEQYEEYPLLDYMPYSNEDFALNYLEPMVLIVKIKGTEREAIMEQVNYWIKSKGVDPESHEIEWN